MNWYVAKLVYRIICGAGNHTPQFDEQLRLFAACTLESALEKAKAAGLAEQVQFPNQHNQLVEWRFIDVADLYQLHQVVDGTELYSRIEERPDGAGYEHYVRDKAQWIAAQTTSLQLT